MIRLVILAAVFSFVGARFDTPVLAQAKKSDAVIKVTAKGSKPDADGKQTVTISLQVDDGWHIYANPPGDDVLQPVKTVVRVTGKDRLLVKVNYPPGKLIEDKDIGIAFRFYEGKIEVKALVQPVDGQVGPLEVTVKIGKASNDRVCLSPATVKVPVE
jgi:DsbC/DsbD-like thiol-disulfide interchange protein